MPLDLPALPGQVLVRFQPEVSPEEIQLAAEWTSSAFLQRSYLAPESHELFLIAVDQHRAIVEAIGARESARAENVSREHARVARRNLEKSLLDISIIGVRADAHPQYDLFELAFTQLHHHRCVLGVPGCVE